MQSQINSHPKIELKHWIALIPLIIAIGIAPFYLHTSVINYPAIPVTWRNTPQLSADLFTYGKRFLLLAAAALAVIMLYFKLPKNLLKKESNKFPLILIGLTFVWLLVSSFFSIFKYGAFWGATEKYEGAFIWGSYLIFALYTASLCKDKIYQLLIPRIVLFSGFIVTGIGFSQFISHDIVRTNWFLNLVMSKEMVASTHFAFEADRVYSTLYNPNFVAMYVATILPLAIYMVFRERSKIFKSLWSLYCLLLIVNLIGSKSNGGYLGIIFGCLALLFVMLSKKLDLKKVKILSTGILISALLVFTAFVFGAFNSILGLSKFDTQANLSDISVDGFTTTIRYNGNDLIAEADSNTLDAIRFYNSAKVQLNVHDEADGTYSIVSPDFSNIRFSTGLTEAKMAYVNFIIDGTNWVFLLHPNGMLYVNSFSCTAPIETASSLGKFAGYENFGSARGYIWSRTLPLIAASPIWGYGADNFTIAFPQTDYVMKYKLYGTPSILVDKAHNFFLQVIMNFGLVGFMLFLTLIAYAVRSLYLAYYNNTDEDRYFSIAILLCIISYIGAGQFYDSNLHVSPFFWTFIGFGLKDIFKA